ncbi:MAG: hypothetical protein JWP09_772 [Candidatus Taylorbacteria bacterium]|nr:hypothetical protein [Candidatus Taylorbacteria bacterium]
MDPDQAWHELQSHLCLHVEQLVTGVFGGAVLHLEQTVGAERQIVLEGVGVDFGLVLTEGGDGRGVHTARRILVDGFQAGRESHRRVLGDLTALDVADVDVGEVASNRRQVELVLGIGAEDGDLVRDDDDGRCLQTGSGAKGWPRVLVARNEDIRQDADDGNDDDHFEVTETARSLATMGGRDEFHDGVEY